MKLNWGSYIVIAYSIFILFILYFVYQVQTNSKYSNDLVVEEYYKHDAHYQDELDKIQNAEDLPNKPFINKIPEGVLIVFPTVFDSKKIRGKVLLYRSANKKLDFKVPITAATFIIPDSLLVSGLWNVSILWTYDKKEFITKKTIYY